MVGETIDKHVDKYFETGKAAEALDKRLLRNDGFLVPTALFVYARKKDAFAAMMRLRTQNHAHGNAGHQKCSRGSREQPCARSTGSYEFQKT